VLFVETVGPEPQLAAVNARFKVLEDFPNITVLRLQFPTWQWPDGRLVDSERRRIVREFIQGPGAGQFEGAVQWFYDPMAITAFAGHMAEVLTVYDCMDELSKFRGAPPELLAREAELLKRAEVVFTGGRRLYEAKSRYNDNCHFYGCGVDCEHFGKAREAATSVPLDVENLPRPILGYFGVVDERMDYELVAKLAEANPSGSVIIVGPTTKVDPGSLPQRPNLHWLGQRPYSDLPAYCKAMDVCLMPFALNESTEFINPTKALEYMATGRPIVSTAVPDVVRNFGEVVRIAHDPEHFVSLCANAVEQPDPQSIGRGLQMAQTNSWDSIVSQLENHIQEALHKTRSVKLS
jgi:glycosyltransferase involved in cell wall biosynthesis